MNWRKERRGRTRKYCEGRSKNWGGGREWGVGSGEWGVGRRLPVVAGGEINRRLQV